MEKAVIGATKPKCMYPKQKYLDTLLYGAASSMHNTMLIMNALQPRLSSNTWTTSFKSLLVVHLLTRSEAGNDVLSYCASQKGILSAAYRGGANSGHSGTIRTYAAYLIEKVYVYGELQRDPVRTGVQGRDGYLRTLPLSKGLLHHVSCLQKQISTLLACKFYVDELSNEVTIGAFALLVQDLLRLFQAMNEGVINILQNFFEMGKDEARLGLKIYKVFAEQTTRSVEYFSVAKRMESVIHITIPQLKHAPLSLVRTLEEYVNSPDFEEEQKSAKSKEPAAPKKSATTTEKSKSPKVASPKNDDDTWAPKQIKEESKPAPKKDIIDFFSSIDNEETVIQQSPSVYQAQSFAGDEFQQFQLQLQQQNQMQQLQQMQQMQAQQNMMLQNQFTGVAPQQTGFSTNPFSHAQQSQNNMFQNNMGSMDFMNANNTNNGVMGGIAPQSTGNPFRLGTQSMATSPAPQMPMMTGVSHFNTMPNLSSPSTSSTNPFAPSTNPLNPFSPNFGKVATQPTGMAGMNTGMNTGMNMGMSTGMNTGMNTGMSTSMSMNAGLNNNNMNNGNMFANTNPTGMNNNNPMFGNNNMNNMNNIGMMSQPTGAGSSNPWGQQ